MESAIWEIVCGSVAGALGKFIDYPFDTIKVRMQTQGSNIFPTTWSCIKYTYENEGIRRGFYQGIASPMFGAMLENAILFVSYNQCSLFLNAYTSLSLLSIILISGAVAGSCASLVLTPIELIKCQLQVSNLELQLHDDNDSENLRERHTSIIPTIRAIVKEKGIMGLWQGQLGTFVRESIGSLIWFATFELLKRYFINKNNDGASTTTIHSWQLLVSGAIAGFVFNGSVFPVDTVKSLMQTEHLSFKEAIDKIKIRYGIPGFYRGLGITLIRSLPSNAVVFYTYEKLSNLYPFF